ncbi:MAG: glycoside hydrolase family 3 N-terminal domain-containing protein [Eubacteriales bacterium]|nr:glycoside hydrolase family 3 N-terminal domain-containing protein [Eubacteriales bacterium]
MLGKDYISNLLSQMTLKEKAAEMTQLWGENPDGTLMGILRGFHQNEHLSANAGSLLGFCGAQRVLEAQRLHMEESAHHIPLLFMTDVIHGYKTIFPSVLGLGAAWDPSLIEESASVAAAEASVSGVHVTFSPMADLVRDARWGRVIESTGEDPYLNSLCSAAFTRGYQGDGIGKPLHIASCVKHFIGYGAVEGGRDYDSAQIGDYQLFNDYLPPFLAAVEAGCELLMPGFNTLNGVPCTASRRLLQEILKDFMHFQGVVISDCTAVCELVPHGICEDQAQAAALSIGAGVDVEMVSSSFYDHLEKLIETGAVSMAQVDGAVERILTLKDKMGLFENPYKDASPQKEQELHLCGKHRQLARKAAAQSLVLLQNQNQALPLQNNERIALIGPYADSRKLLDIWGLVNGKEEDCVTLYEAFGEHAACAQGCRLWNLRNLEEERPSDADLIAQALELADKSDKIVLAIGEHPDMSAEAGSRTDLELPANQIALLKALHDTQKPIVTVVFTGRPLVLTEIARYSSAVVIAWFPGTEGGRGIADVLTGRCAPTGRLPMSFPRATGQAPIYYNHLPTGRPNTTNSYQPFANGYIGIEPGPLYPFGFGLTYTEFSYSEVTLSCRSVTCTAPSEQKLLTASTVVTNTGSRTGEETVQLYIQDVAGTYSRPVRMLKGFQKITLGPGESRTVAFSISPRMLEYYIPQKGISLEEGTFRIYIGPHAESTQYQEFLVKGGY